jgi:hypothetical protein
MPASRTREQDALTIFDEGGAVVAATQPAALRLAQTAEHAFEAALRELCAASEARVVPFGHALFEHMIEGLPCPGASACVLGLPSIFGSSRDLLRCIDDALALRLADPRQFRTPRQAMHLRLQALEAVMSGELR